MTIAGFHQWPDADRLLDEALSLDGAARKRFLDDVRGRNHALADALAAVLAEEDTSDGFLQPGAPLSGALASDLAREDEGDEPIQLTPGTRLAGYEILALEGRGGMGEVYRARDLRLSRTVALKILPDRFARHPERLARFEREARLLASLSHPRIAGIFGIAEEGTTRSLVLEWVDGPTLADRLARGPMRLDEAMEIGIQIAEALETAHERGIVHRDLKPANVKLTPSGVKVLDFGLAKAVVAGEGSSPDDLSTMLDRPGAVLGTASYMSPEQARAQRVDHRADIWAFGCVLAEMLSGQRVFRGETTHEIIAGVLERPPDLSALPSDIPPELLGLLDRCLAKDPRRRLGWIGDAAVTLEELRAGPQPVPSEPGPAPRWRRAWPVLGALAVGAVAAGVLIPLLRQSATPPVTRLAIPVPPTDALVAGDLPTVALSRDGRDVVYRARRAGLMRLYHRSLESADPVPISGSDHAMAPSVSPDGGWVLFSRDNTLLKVPRTGGNPIVICRTEGAVSSAWAPAGFIIFGGEQSRGLRRVDASGGEPVPVTTLDDQAGEIAHGLPELLPNGRDVLFTVWPRDGDPRIAIAPLSGGPHRTVLEDARQARLAAPDLLAFVRQRSVWVVGFDARRGVLSGSPVSAVDGVDTSVVSGNAHFAVSGSGNLVYLPRRSERSRARQIVWKDRTGREQIASVAPGAFTRAAVSPDGGRVALSTSASDTRDLWMWSSDRGTLTRLTFDDSVDTAPIWLPDGMHLVFRSDRSPPGLYRTRADGAGSAELITESGDAIHTPYDVTRDGRFVIYTEFRTYTDQGIAMVAADGRESPQMLVDGPFAEVRPKLSPDGRWMAYPSDESGRFEIYVRPFPDVRSGRWQVSTGGGVTPLWGPDGREIFYYSDGTIMRVPVSADAQFVVGDPERLFGVDLVGDRVGPIFDVSPDGQRFLFLRPVDTDGSRDVTHLSFVEHWAHEGARLATPR